MAEWNGVSRGRSSRVVAAGLALGVVSLGVFGTGCARWTGGPIEDNQVAPMPPGSILRMETQQRGTRVLLTNAGEVPLTVRWPADGARSFTIAPGSTWKKRLRWEHELEVTNPGDEPSRLLIDAKSWNFQMGYAIEHEQPGTDTASESRVRLMPATGAGARR